MRFERKHIDKELKLIAKDLEKALSKQLGKEGLSNSGLANDIDFKITKDGFSLNIPGYGKYVDEGTKPHMPPVDSLKKWSTARGLNPWAVANSIKKWGTKPQPFLFVINDNQNEYVKRIANAGLEDVIVMGDAIIKKSGGKIV